MVRRSHRYAFGSLRPRQLDAMVMVLLLANPAQGLDNAVRRQAEHSMDQGSGSDMGAGQQTHADAYPGTPSMRVNVSIGVANAVLGDRPGVRTCKEQLDVTESARAHSYFPSKQVQKTCKFWLLKFWLLVTANPFMVL